MVRFHAHPPMYYAYVLQSTKNFRFYYGSTQNLEVRLKQHNNGKTYATKFLRPLKLIYFERFSTLKEARTQERFFKSGKGREYIKLKLSG